MATVVRVWFGEETPGSSEIIRILERMAEGKPLWEIFVLGSFTVERQLKDVIFFLSKDLGGGESGSYKKSFLQEKLNYTVDGIG